MLNCRRGNIKKFVCSRERKKEIWKVLYSTFILFMYSWIFYTEATQNKYLNNIQQCNIELVQYFGFQEIFSFLSSTFFFFFLGSALTCICSFPMAIYKKIFSQSKNFWRALWELTCGRKWNSTFCLHDNRRANLFNLLNNYLQWWRYTIM